MSKLVAALRHFDFILLVMENPIICLCGGTKGKEPPAADWKQKDDDTGQSGWRMGRQRHFFKAEELAEYGREGSVIPLG